MNNAIEINRKNSDRISDIPLSHLFEVAWRLAIRYLRAILDISIIGCLFAVICSVAGDIELSRLLLLEVTTLFLLSVDLLKPRFGELLFFFFSLTLLLTFKIWSRILIG